MNFFEFFLFQTIMGGEEKWGGQLGVANLIGCSLPSS
jgi:hypothetical protein